MIGNVRCRMKNIAKTSLALYRRVFPPFDYNSGLPSSPLPDIQLTQVILVFFISYFIFKGLIYIYIYFTASIPMPKQIRHRLAPSGSHKDRIPFQHMVVEGDISSNVSQIRKSFKHMIEGDVPHSIRVELEKKGEHYSGKECFWYGFSSFWSESVFLTWQKDRLRSLKRI